eukprot:8257513-Pyramimonas_sp.AAC.1
MAQTAAGPLTASVWERFACSHHWPATLLLTARKHVCASAATAIQHYDRAPLQYCRAACTCAVAEMSANATLPSDENT